MKKKILLLELKEIFRTFPNTGLKFLLPREVFILNKNLDAISALIILDYFNKIYYEPKYRF